MKTDRTPDPNLEDAGGPVREMGVEEGRAGKRLGIRTKERTNERTIVTWSEGGEENRREAGRRRSGAVLSGGCREKAHALRRNYRRTARLTISAG